MGLLGNGFDDPQSSAILALAGGLLQGNFGAGVTGANAAYQGAQDGLLKRQLTQGQIKEQAIQQALQQYQLQRLQNWDKEINGSGSAPAIPSDAISSPGAFVPPAAGGMGPVAPMSEAPQALTQPGFRYGLPGRTDQQSRAVAGAMTPDAYMKIFAEQTAPQTEITKLLAAQGIDPSSPIGKQAIQAAVEKANYVAPVNARPGSILRDPRTGLPFAFNPHIPDGSTPSFDASGNVIGMTQIPGALPAIAGVQQAKTIGVADATPSIAYDASGKPIFSTKGTDVRRASGPIPGVDAPPMTAAQADTQSTPAQRATGDVASLQREIAAVQRSLEPAATKQMRLQVLNAELAKAQAGAQAPAAGGATPVPILGAKEGAVLSQDELGKKGASLMADNGQTNTVISRLQNIKMLAPGAITGAESSRRDFMNGLLSLAGIKGAEDAKTASDLVDKNSAQIVSALRMGQGGAGTDALQTLLGAANPNRHMTKEAINDAADQLIASQKMIQDKARILQPHYLGRDPVAYGQKEMTFDQNADPRVWQLQSMNPQQQAAYIKTLPADVAADMLKKRQALKTIGALQ